MADAKEVWKTVEWPWNGYEVSNLGTVRNIETKKKVALSDTGRLTLESNADSSADTRTPTPEQLRSQYFV